MNFVKSFNKSCKSYMNPLLCCIATVILLWCLLSVVSEVFREGFTGASPTSGQDGQQYATGTTPLKTQ